MKVLKPRIVIIRPWLNGWGTGHAIRMNLLAPVLNGQVFIREDGDIPADLYILDWRDQKFPPLKKADALKVVIDNFGIARKSADLALDVLYHPSQNQSELNKALSQTILPPFILPYRNTRKKSIIRLAGASTYQYQVHLKQEAYLNRLLHQVRPKVYFSQTMMELLFIGKSIDLIWISEYHRKLVESFARVWEGLINPWFYIDGQGINRIAKQINRLLY